MLHDCHVWCKQRKLMRRNLFLSPWARPALEIRGIVCRAGAKRSKTCKIKLITYLTEFAPWGMPVAWARETYFSSWHCHLYGLNWVHKLDFCYHDYKFWNLQNSQIYRSDKFRISQNSQIYRGDKFRTTKIQKFIVAINFGFPQIQKFIVAINF